MPLGIDLEYMLGTVQSAGVAADNGEPQPEVAVGVIVFGIVLAVAAQYVVAEAAVGFAGMLVAGAAPADRIALGVILAEVAALSGTSMVPVAVEVVADCTAAAHLVAAGVHTSAAQEVCCNC